ncbi:MAG: hypothetical protein KDC48_11095, partial [Planctomycetes bacterium]|nr:hypothetical protein [Planctomycetota bacterium]
LGVKFVIAESYELIYRSNLVCIGVLPLQFAAGQTRESLGLSGHEAFDLHVDDALRPGQMLDVVATHPDTGKVTKFQVQCRIDTPVEVDYYRNGGILQTVIRKLLGSDAAPAGKAKKPAKKADKKAAKKDGGKAAKAQSKQAKTSKQAKKAKK